MKKQVFKHEASYSSVRSSILACASVIVSVATLKLSLWWELLLALFGLIILYYFFTFILRGLDYLIFYKLAGANIVTDNKENTERLLQYVDELHQMMVDYDSSLSDEWKDIEKYRMELVYKKARSITNVIIGANEGAVKTGQSKYHAALINSIREFLDEVHARDDLFPSN